MKIYEPLALLQLLATARGPSGEENEIRAVCSELMRPICDDFWQDATGNVIGKIEGKDKSLPPIRIFVHMDELALSVKRINDDGSLNVTPLSRGMFPHVFGQGLMEIMGDRARLQGILSYGSVHVTSESPDIKKHSPKSVQGKGETVEWEDTYIVTRKTPEQLKTLGVHPGTRVVIAQSRRELQRIEDCVAGYFMDNRAAIASALIAVNHFQVFNEKPAADVYLVATVAEEIGGHGACYAARTLPGDVSIAVDVGPVAKEYQTELNASPIVVYQDGISVYDKGITDKLVDIGFDIGVEPQVAVFNSYGSDASIAKRYGHSAKAALLCIPTENTHGFEIIHQEGIQNAAELLYAFLKA